MLTLQISDSFTAKIERTRAPMNNVKRTCRFHLVEHVNGLILLTTYMNQPFQRGVKMYLKKK